MENQDCVGLPSSWLNAWLAALGVTVLLPQVSLSWSDTGVPHARFGTNPEEDLAQMIACALPSVSAMQNLAVAKCPKRKVLRSEYRSAAEVVRLGAEDSLSFYATDLRLDPKARDEVTTGPFNVSVPKGITLLQRAMTTRNFIGDDVDASAHMIAECFAGRGSRVKCNGLGFDYRRLVSAVHENDDKFVDPVIETLCFYGLFLFPIRGDGSSARQRGWDNAALKPNAFRWPTWNQHLDRWAIDAFLDQFYSWEPSSGRQATLGVTSVHGSMPYQPRGTSDVTRAYGSVRVS